MAVTQRTISDDLYTKIALDNKLVTQFYLRKATEEQEKLDREGKKLDLGAVMVKLGILTDRQHQSVVNACLYREQRDYDKRFGRQCLRMSLISQDKIEEALSAQKNEYMKSGAVRPMSDFLVELGSLTTEQVAQVHEGIQQRDKAKKEVVRSGRNQGVSSASVPALPSGKAGEAQKKAPAAARKRDSGESDVDDAELEEDEEEEELDDVDLDDVDLDDEELEDADLDDVDLDEDDLDEDEGDDLDEELEAADLDEAERELSTDKGGSKAATATSGSKAATPPAPRGKAALDEDEDEPRVDLQGLDLDPDQDGAEDEEDLAEDVSEVDSEVDLDDEDLKALEEMDSGDQTEDQEDATWAADAFDDRPLDKRAPSERIAVAPLPPPPPPPPPAPASPAAPPVVPAAAGSARMPRWMKAAQAGKAREGEPPPPPPAPAAAAPISKEPPAKAPPAAKALADTASEVEPPAPVPARGKRPASGPLAPAGEEDGSDILGADVFEGNISEERPIPVELRGKGGKTASSSRAELPKADKPSTSGRHKTGKKGESERAAASSASSRKTEPAPEARKSSARLEKKTSGRGPAVKADKPEPQVGKAGKAEKAGEAMDSKAKKHSGRRAAVGAPSDVMPALSTPSDTGKTSDSGISLDLGDLTELDDEPGQKPKPKGLPAGLDEAKLRRAFDKAMERAWKAFLEELRG